MRIPTPFPGWLALGLLLCAGSAAAERAHVVYTVAPGDRLESVAQRLLADRQAWREVARLNGMGNADRLRPGQTLRIPRDLLKEVPSDARVSVVSGTVQINDQAAQAGQTLREGDRITTADNGSAVLQLADGSRVQVLPSSVAELLQHRQYEPQQAAPTPRTTWYTGTLRLVQGTLQTLAQRGALRATPLEVKTPTSVVGVRGTQFRVGFDAQARSEVLSGSVAAENPAQGSSAVLPAGTGAVIRPEEARIEVKRLLPAPALPAELPALNNSETWSWPGTAGAAAWRVQVASDAGFDRIVANYRVEQPQLPPGAIPAGQWHVRVRAVDGDGLEGLDAVRGVQVVAATPWGFELEPLAYRAEGSELRWRAVTLRGQPVPVSRWTLVWDDTRLGQPLPEVSVTQPDPVLASATLPPLPAGTYGLRLTGADAQGKPLISQRFELRLPTGWGSNVTTLRSPLRTPID